MLVRALTYPYLVADLAWLGSFYPISVHLHLPSGYSFGCERPGLVEPGCPEPFVDPSPSFGHVPHNAKSSQHLPPPPSFCEGRGRITAPEPIPVLLPLS